MVKGGNPMTEKKDINLTAEEQAQIAEEKPTLLEALKTGHPAAKGWLVAWRRKQSAIEEARNQADKIQQEVAAAVDLKQGNLLRWCGYPTDMTRCSPFFPFNAKELGHREFLRDFVITSANWGQITYTGPQLSIYEEDALMVLLALLEQVSQNREVAKVEGMRRTYTYKGPALPLLRLLGHKQPSKREYVRLIAALKLMVVAGIEMSISAGKTKSGKKRAPRFIHIVNMLSNVFWDEEKKELSATINPYFYEAYFAGQITLMDVSKRMSLRGSIAKAMYRFVQSHRTNPVFTGHFLTLADALNMDHDQPGRKTRENLKRAINELIQQGVLRKNSGFVDKYIVNLERTSKALPSRKEISNQWLEKT